MDKFKVLVVDDEPGMRMGVLRVLKNYEIFFSEFSETISFELMEASSGEKCLEIIANNPPDILILDHKLPGIQGLDILSQLRAEKKNICAIMITAFSSLEVAITATKNGAFDFLAKPFTPDELKNTIDKAVKHTYLQKKARKLEEEKRQVRFQFLSVLAHELKSPLAAIEGHLQLMECKIAGDSIDAYKSMIERSILRIDGMRKMIYDMLDLTRIESGNRERKIATHNIVALAHDALDAIRIDATKKNLQLNFEAPSELLLPIDADEITIVFNNLLTNAVKYNKMSGTILFKITRHEDYLSIVCQDSGIGMKKEDVAKLFGEFVRIKNEKTRDILGSGLGLSILKKILHLNQAEIKIESAEGEGTTFTITWPIITSLA
ncbi:MAG: response regulator [Oligoflexia bacterium]|nr:response regulator [Oligoflexia bacterium]MBF0366470.1 response regulator [Oligoflexia bacterium]